MPTLIDPQTAPNLGGQVHAYAWTWKSRPIQIAYEVLGSGPSILLLPAFSSISTRAEMAALAAQLASTHRVVVLDWPGFGQSDRPSHPAYAAMYHGLLQDFVTDQFTEAVPVVAAGHAAGYVLHLAATANPFSALILVAPTWRGPLPTAMGDRPHLYRRLKWLVWAPVLGPLLYWLNTHPAFLRWMMGRHVYADANHITPEVMAAKWQTTQQPGARFASAAFVTGGLDPLHNRAEALDRLDQISIPITWILGEQTPPKSKAEMAALAQHRSNRVHWVPGSLGLHEEYGTDLAHYIQQALGDA